MKRTITLRHLRSFIAVAETGSFTLAAQRVFLTQSTLTTSIKQLEASLGLRLFDRTTRQVTLTQAAVHFRQHAEALLRDFDTLIDDTRALARGYVGHLRIAASPSIVTLVLAPALASLRQQAPGITVALRDGGSAEIERRVRDGEVDFGVCSRLQNYPELQYQPLIRDRYAVVCSPDHPLGQGEGAVTWADVARWRSDWVGLASDTLVGRVHQEILGQDMALDYIEEVSGTALLPPLLALGNRYSIIPLLAWMTQRFEGFPLRPLAEPPLERELCLVTRRLRSMSPAAAHLLQAMRDVLRGVTLPDGTSIIEPADTPADAG